jgi:ankyrin repeat protein
LNIWIETASILATLFCKEWLEFIEDQRTFLQKDIELAKKNHLKNKDLMQFWNKIEHANPSKEHLQIFCKLVRKTMSEIKWTSFENHHRTNYDFNKNFNNLKYLFIHGSEERLEFSLPYIENKDFLADIGRSTPFAIAARTANFKVYKLLQDNYSNYKHYKFLHVECLTAAASSGSLDMFKHVLQDIQLDKITAKNPFHEACKSNATPIVELILQKIDHLKMEVNSGDKSKNTPLHFAAQNGNWAVFQMILQRLNMDENDDDKDEIINPRNHKGFTPLHFAAGSNNFQLFEYIFQQVEDKNPISRRRLTIAHFAAQVGNIQVLKCLNQFDIDLFYGDLCDQSPKDYAIRNGHLEAVQYLEKVQNDRFLKKRKSENHQNIPPLKRCKA